MPQKTRATRSQRDTPMHFPYAARLGRGLSKKFKSFPRFSLSWTKTVDRIKLSALDICLENRTLRTTRPYTGANVGASISEVVASEASPADNEALLQILLSDIWAQIAEWAHRPSPLTDTPK